MKLPVKFILIDLLAGFAIIIALIIVASSIKLIFTSSLILFFLAGYILGERKTGNTWIHIFFINLLYITENLIGAGINPPVITIIMLVFPVIFTYFGFYLRHHWKKISKLKKYILIPVLGAFILLSGLIGIPGLEQYYMTEKVNNPAPQFELSTFAGDTIKSSEFIGQVVVLDFWATWCKPCIEEFPKLESIYTKYKENPNVVFIAVNTSRMGDTLEKAIAFSQKNSYNFSYAYDVNARVTDLFNVEIIPVLILIDRRGHVRIRHTGYDESENLVLKISNNIDELLSEN